MTAGGRMQQVFIRMNQVVGMWEKHPNFSRPHAGTIAALTG